MLAETHMHRTDDRWGKRTLAHSFILLNILLTLCPVSLKGEQYLTSNCSSFCYLASWWQPAGVREIETDMRADSVHHIPPQSERRLPDLSLSVHLCVFYSVCLGNLKWQEMKSTVICVESDHFKHILVCKGWRDQLYCPWQQQISDVDTELRLLEFCVFTPHARYRSNGILSLMSETSNKLQRIILIIGTGLNEMLYLDECGWCVADRSEKWGMLAGEFHWHVLLCTSVHLSNAPWSDIKSVKSLDPWISCQTIFTHKRSLTRA